MLVMTSFPKIQPLFYCPDIIRRDNKLLKSRTMIIDAGECFSLIMDEVFYHSDYKLFFVKDKRKIIETLINDANETLELEEHLLYYGFNPTVEEDKNLDALFYDIEMYLVDSHYELLREFQRIRWDDNPDWAYNRSEEIEEILNKHRENYENKEYGREVLSSNGTIWSDMGYKASANSSYWAMQKLLFDAYDRNPNKYSPQQFYQYCEYLRNKNGANRNQFHAHIRRLRDYKALKHYVETGERRYIANINDLEL